MSGRVIQGLELGTNPTKLWRALGKKPKEAKNVVKSCRGYFVRGVRVRHLAVSWCMTLAGICLQSPAGGVRKEDSERNGAHRRPYYFRKRGRSGVILLLLVLLALALTAAEGTRDDLVKMPPPPGGSTRQQLSEQDLRSIHGSTDVTISLETLERLVRMCREGAKRRREEAKEMDEEGDKWQERVKLLRQTLQGCAKQDQPEEGEVPGDAKGPNTTQKLKLKFNGSLSDTIYTKDSLLRYSNGGPIEIAICSGDQIITSDEKLSSLEVEIVALNHGHTCKGEWTEHHFDHQIIRSGQGSKRVSVLDGEVIVKLDHGKASIGNIHFKEGSHRAGGNSFILAARVFRKSRSIIGKTRVEEALMDDYPFLVLTERSKANKKIVTPKLNDEVHGLKGIKRNGDYENRLKKAGINTVQKFVKALNEDPEKLRCQILNINSENNRSWRDMVEHARKCDLSDDHRLKSCTLQVQKSEVTLFFDVVHYLVGAEFRGCFVAKGEFTEEQEVVVDDVLQLAFQELNDTFDHIMKDNRPVNIHASINAAGSRSVPISGIDCADGSLPGTPGQSAPPEPRSDHRNEIANQGVGQNHTPIGVNGMERVNMLDVDQQGENCTPRGGLAWDELLALVRESDISNPALDRSTGGNFDLSTNEMFGEDQAAGNSASGSGNYRTPGAILGDANRNSAELSTPDHEATIQAAASGRQSQPNNALGFASTWNLEASTSNLLEDPLGQGTTQGFASTSNLFEEEEPPVQCTTSAALDQSQPNTAPRFAPSWNPFEDPPGQVNRSHQAYTAVNTQTIQDQRSMQMPSPQVEDPGFYYNGSSQQYWNLK